MACTASARRRDDDPLAGSPLRRSTTRQEPRLRARGGSDAGARDRGEHGDLPADRGRAAALAAREGSGGARGDPHRRHGGRAGRLQLLARGSDQPAMGGDPAASARRVGRLRLGHGGAEPRVDGGAALRERGSRERPVLLHARRAPCAGTPAHRRGRPEGLRGAGRRAEPHVLAARVRQRSGDGRPHDQAGPLPVSSDRCRGAGLHGARGRAGLRRGGSDLLRGAASRQPEPARVGHRLVAGGDGPARAGLDP